MDPELTENSTGQRALSYYLWKQYIINYKLSQLPLAGKVLQTFPNRERLYTL